jgi:Tfp pilus assembly protein FimT
MIVLVVIGIVTAVMVSDMSGTFQDGLLRSSSRQLIGVFNLASSRAISVNRQQRVHFDSGNNRFAIEQHERGDEFEPARGLAESEGTIDSRISWRVRETDADEAPDPSRPPSIDNAVNFYPDGTSDGGEIELRDRDGKGLVLRVSPVTARVEIKELPHE